MTLSGPAPRYQRASVFHPVLPPVFTATVELRGDSEQHSHDFLETAIVRSGTGTHVAAGSSHQLREGSFVVVRPGAWHGYAECRDLVVTNCCFGSELFGRELEWLREDRAVSRLLWSAPGRAGAFVGLLDQPAAVAARLALDCLADSFASPKPAQRTRVLGWLAVLLAELADGLTPGAGSSKAPVPASVVAALRLLDETPEQPWNVTDLASRVAVGQAHLSRLFTAHLGTPPMTYLGRLRAERSAALLRESADSVSRIGAIVGWSDPNYFARRFRAHFGMSPREYRSRLHTGTAPADHARPKSLSDWTGGNA